MYATKQRKAYVDFIDLKKAFDKISKKKFWKILEEE